MLPFAGCNGRARQEGTSFNRVSLDAGAPTRGHFLSFSQVINRVGWEVKQLGHQAAAMWDAPYMGAGWVFTPFAIILVPDFHFF